MSKRVAVLMGGLSGEATISYKTGNRVLNSLNNTGYIGIPVEVNSNFLNWISKNIDNVDIFFNALHGSWGEDGKIQGILEYTGKPYTHSNVLSSAVCMNKYLSRQILLANGIPMARAKLIDKNTLISNDPLPRPYVIKPISEGSSIGVNCIFKETIIENKMLSEYSERVVLVEKYIPGRELTVAIKGGEPLGMIEIITKDNFYDYKAKYTTGISKYVNPEKFPNSIAKFILDISKRANDVLNCFGITRVDLRYDEEKGIDGVYVLEINTQPGLTDTSLVPMIAERCGVDFDQLIDWIIRDAESKNEKFIFKK